MLSSEDMPAFEAGERTPARPESETYAVREQLQKILDSKQFSRAESLRRLLRFLVEQTLLGRGNRLNEYSLGQEVFDRGERFDPKIDTIVRVQTRKLRARLDEYYRTQGRNDTIGFKLPKGGYEVVIETRAPALPAEPVAEGPQTRPARKRLLWFSLAALSAVIALAFYVISRAPGRAAMKTLPFTTFAGWELDPAFSPDGRQIAFAWNGQGQDNFDIYIKGIHSGAPLRLTTHPGEDRNPVWSPDGQRLAFIRRFKGEDAVFIVPALGGSERRVHTLSRALVLCPIGVSCLSWSPDGDSLAIVDKTLPENAQSVFLLSLSTLQLRQLTYPPTAQSWGDVSPAFSPDGRSLAFIRWSTTGSDAFIIPVAGGEPRQVTSDRRILFSVDWMPDGQELVYSSNRAGSGGIWAVPVSGDHPRLVVATSDIAVVSAARRGNRLAYWNGPLSPDTNIWRIDLTRAADPPARVIGSTRQEMSADFSPEGDRIVYNSNSSGSHEIWICDRDGRNPLQLTTFDGRHAGSPRWSPDGRTIAFDAQSTRSSDADIYVIDVETRLPRRLTVESSEEIVPCWSEDARWIYFGSARTGDWQIWKIPAQGGRAVQVTKAGGVITVGAKNGFVYYMKNMEASIWRVPEQGGREEAVVDTPAFHFSRYSALTGEGIYFLDSKAAHPVPKTISFLNFDTRRVTQIAAMPGKPLVWEAGISVSADGRWMLYTQVDENSGDITLVENFR